MMWRAVVCALLGFAAFVSGAQAQRYPERPLRLMLGFAPSGSADIIARVFAEQLQKQLGVNVIPDNRPGAGGTLAYATVAHAAPDGYTMLFVTPSFVTASVIYKNLQFDPHTAFAAVTHVANGPANVLVVNPSMPVKTVADLVKLAKSGKVSYGSPGVGAVQHFVAELFNLRAGVRIAHIPYKGQAPALTALLGDEVNLVFLQPPGGVDLIKAGRIRALAYAGASRWPVMPDLPTVTEAGIPDFQLAGPYEGILVPARTPAALVGRLHAEITKTLETPQLRAALAQATWAPDGRGPAPFGEFMRAEMKRYSAIAREANITAQ
jgi:tripartite-type tricarboxylate transporter receptor subunit TctC